MSRRLTSKDALFVSKLPQSKLREFKAGISLVDRTGYSLDALVAKVTEHRMWLAVRCRDTAERLLRLRPPECRAALSRSYYSLYHQFRAVSYFMNQGDDYEKHAKLPEGIPQDFPNRSQWAANLKSARLERNRADYDPYPHRDSAFLVSAQAVLKQATDLSEAAKKYLRSKGWRP